MKRSRRPPLLALQEPPTYVVDTSAWLNIDARDDAATAWDVMIAMITDDRIVAPAEVVEELKNHPHVWARVHNMEDKLKGAITSGDDYLLLAGRIADAHPGISGIRSRKTRADPFIVALAELEHFVVVTDETTTKRPSRKLPTVCEARNVHCVSLNEMLEAELARTARG